MAWKDKKEAVRYNNRYNRENYERIALYVRKGRKEEIKKAAEEAGESLNAFISKAVDERMKS